jgi:hypothetical protein
MWTPEKGNTLLMWMVVTILCGWSLYAPWGDYHFTAEDHYRHARVNGRPIERKEGASPASLGMIISARDVPGRLGTALIGPLSLRYWLAPALLLAGVVLGALNRIRFCAVPTRFIGLLRLLPPVLLLVYLVDMVVRGGVSALSWGWIPLAVASVTAELIERFRYQSV